MTTTTTGTRHECASTGSGFGSHTRGDGQPKRKSCAYCGGAFRVYRGRYGVFTWSADNRYPAADAHRTFTREAAANRYAAANDYVVRWIPAND